MAPEDGRYGLVKIGIEIEGLEHFAIEVDPACGDADTAGANGDDHLPWLASGMSVELEDAWNRILFSCFNCAMSLA